MTVAQLERAVAHLGFTSSLEDGGELFREAASRALGEISAVRPRLGTVSLWHLPIKPLLLSGSTESVTGEGEYLLPAGGSVFLRVHGQGDVLIETTLKTYTYPFLAGWGERPTVITHCCREGEATRNLRIRAGSGYRLLTLAVYAERFEKSPPDPIAPIEYDLSQLIEDFAELSSPPTYPDGEALREGADGSYTCPEGHRLRLSIPTATEVHIHYRRALKLPESGELPLGEEEASLLPLFCAAYVFFDEEPERSSFYLARFREGLAAIAPREERVASFRDTTGWG